MGFKLSLKDIGNFATGAIERDKQITKENLIIRAEELKANRDSMLIFSFCLFFLFLCLIY